MKNKITSILFFATIFGLSLLCLVLPKSDFSESERRVLEPFPEVSAESIFGGDFANGFEAHATDTFPFRDTFRSFKAYASKFAFLRSDNNKLYSKDGHRLGYGKGFYDRFLANFDGVSVGFTYDELVVDDLPHDAFDMKLDMIITEKGVYLSEG